MNTSSLEAGLAANATAITVFYSVVVGLGLIANAGFIAYAFRRPLGWRERVSRFYWRPWGDIETVSLLAMLSSLFFLMLFFRERLVAVIEGLGVAVDSGLIILQSVLFHWIGLALVIGWLAWKKIPWSSAFGIRLRLAPRDIGLGVVILLATMPFLLFYTLLYHLGLQASGQEPSMQDVAFAISEETSTGMRVYFFILAVVIAPIFEEIFFRGIAMVALGRRLGAGTAIVVVSTLFAAMHGHVPSIVPLFILSVSLSLAYIYTGSLLVPMIMHSLFNLVSVTLLYTVQ